MKRVFVQNRKGQPKTLQIHLFQMIFKSQTRKPNIFGQNLFDASAPHHSAAQTVQSCLSEIQTSALLEGTLEAFKTSQYSSIELRLKEPVAASDSENRVPSLNCSWAI